MKLTIRQKSLLESQREDPIFMYKDGISGKVNFGLLRLGIVSIYITLSLRPLYERGLILEEDVEPWIHKGVGDKINKIMVKQIFIKSL